MHGIVCCMCNKTTIPDAVCINETDWAEFNAATSTIDSLRPGVVRSPLASPRAPRRLPQTNENAYGELRAPPLPPRKSLSPAETLSAAESTQDLRITKHETRRRSLEPEPDVRHRLTSVITGSTETITGLIDTRHEVPPDPRSFEKPRRACTPQSNSRPLPAPPLDRNPNESRTDTENNHPPDIRQIALENRHSPQERTHDRDRHPEPKPEPRIPHPEPRTIITRNEESAESRAPQAEPRSVHSESRIPHAESRIPHPEARAPHPEARTPHPEARIPHAESRIQHSELRHTERSEKESVNRLLNSECRSGFERTMEQRTGQAPPRQRSLPTSASVGDVHPTKSVTMPKFPSEDVKDPPYENVDVERWEDPAVKKFNPLTHDKHGRKYGENVSYENINLDYIARLVGEGYPKDIVVRALGITRNDLEMACDILHEFGSKLPNHC